MADGVFISCVDGHCAQVAGLEFVMLQNVQVFIEQVFDDIPFSVTGAVGTDHQRMGYIRPEAGPPDGKISAVAPVVPSTCVNGDTVIRGTQETVLNQHSAAAHEIQPVAPSLTAEGTNAAKDDILAVSRIDSIVGRIEEHEVLNADIPAVAQTQTIRAAEAFKMSLIYHTPPTDVDVLCVFADQPSFENGSTFQINIGVGGKMPQKFSNMVHTGFYVKRSAFRHFGQLLIDVIGQKAVVFQTSLYYQHVRGVLIWSLLHGTGEQMQIVKTVFVDFYRQIDRAV